MIYIVLTLILGGGAFYLYNKYKGLEALKQNQETKEKVNELQGKIDSNNTELKSEEEKRQAAREKLAEDLKRTPTDQELIDFFNNRK